MKRLAYLAFLLIPLLISACGVPVIPNPQMGAVRIESKIEEAVYIDGLYMGETPIDVIIIENYPNYLQVGNWKFVLVPPCTYSLIYIEPDAEPREYAIEELLLEWEQP